MGKEKIINILQQTCSYFSDTGGDEAGIDLAYCPECGTRLPTDARFCPECGCGVADFLSESSSGEEEVCHGIIWTDTKKMAEKYGAERTHVVKILEDFINENEGFGINWKMFDMADNLQGLGEATWMDYSEALQCFMNDKRIKPSPSLALFIIGGYDVIPQPCEDNPSGNGTPYDRHVYADFYYCFYGQLALEFLDYTKARCNVARLPLETGRIGNSIDRDLLRYLKASNDVTRQGGIRIGRAVMTTNADWIPASREMSRNLPTDLFKDTDGVTLDNMFLSPRILADMDKDTGRIYYMALNGADMLVFNLHGSCEPEKSGFYSSDLAFKASMLSVSYARIFNTVACWGARYINYAREDSMLLTALYEHGVMLYSGACVPALGKCGYFNRDDTWRIQPAAYSETFMARFSEYECLGTMSAGEAFLKAKCDYYNSSRKVEEDELILATVLMFNLYGNPLLRTKPDLDRLSDIQPADGSKYKSIPFRHTKREVVMDFKKDSGHNDSLLTDIRLSLDMNLQAIHKSITESLYDALGLEPRELKTVEKYSTKDISGNTQNGYLYTYERKMGCINTSFRAKVDERGRLIDAIQTK